MLFSISLTYSFQFLEITPTNSPVLELLLTMIYNKMPPHLAPIILVILAAQGTHPLDDLGVGVLHRRRVEGEDVLLVVVLRGETLRAEGTTDTRGVAEDVVPLPKVTVFYQHFGGVGDVLLVEGDYLVEHCVGFGDHLLEVVGH